MEQLFFNRLLLPVIFIWYLSYVIACNSSLSNTSSDSSNFTSTEIDYNVIKLERKDDCHWPTTACFLECSNATIYQIISTLDTYLNDFPHLICSLHGVSIQFKDVTFTNYTIKGGWYRDAGINLAKLEIDVYDVLIIQEDSFHSVYFQKTETVIFRRMQASLLEPDVFEGFQTVKSFTLDGFSQMKTMCEGLFYPMNETLEMLLLTKFNTYPINLYNLTGHIEFPSLTNLSILDSVIHRIENNSFLGLIAIEHLKLWNCQIKSIEIGSFDSIDKTIKFIDLRHNKLRTLTPELFIDFMNLSDLTILLSENNWDCYNVSIDFYELVAIYSDVFVDFNCTRMSTSTDSSTLPNSSPLPTFAPKFLILLIIYKIVIINE